MYNKNKLANALLSINIGFVNSIMARYFASRLTILAYHRVMSYSKSSYLFDEKLISSTPDVFEKQLYFLKNHFNVINFRYLYECIAAKRDIPEKSVIITFDDGYSDNYDVVFPILKKYNLTATIFITTGLIDKNDTFWFEKVTYWIKHTKVKKLSILNGKYRFVIENNKSEVIGEVLKILKIISNDDRIIALKEMEVYLNVEINESKLFLARPLRWDQVKEMDSYGIEIGSHTVNHPILSNMNNREIHFELYESKKTIEKILNRDTISIAYPVGYNNSYDERVVSIAKECGYKFGITYRHGVSSFDEANRYILPRIHVETDVGLALFKGNILLPRIFLG